MTRAALISVTCLLRSKPVWRSTSPRRQVRGRQQGAAGRRRTRAMYGPDRQNDDGAAQLAAAQHAHHGTSNRRCAPMQDTLAALSDRGAPVSYSQARIWNCAALLQLVGQMLNDSERVLAVLQRCTQLRAEGYCNSELGVPPPVVGRAVCCTGYIALAPHIP